MVTILLKKIFKKQTKYFKMFQENSQCKNLLDYLEAGGSVNYLSAMNQFHIGSGFTRRICDLRAAGHEVIFERRISQSGRTYQEYFLKKFEAKFVTKAA